MRKKERCVCGRVFKKSHDNMVKKGKPYTDQCTTYENRVPRIKKIVSPLPNYPPHTPPSKFKKQKLLGI